MKRFISALPGNGVRYGIVFAFGLVQICRLWFRQYPLTLLKQKRLTLPRDTGTVNVFVGFGARKEDDIYLDYCQNINGEVIRIRQMDVGSMVCLQRVSGWDMLVSLLASFRQITQVCESLPASIAAYKFDFLTFATTQLSSYAYLRAWWRQAVLRFNIREACFVAPDLSAFAAVESGIHCFFKQHGLLSKSLVYPGFNRVSALSRYEAEYLASILPAAEIVHRQCVDLGGGQDVEKNNSAILVSELRTLDDMALVKEVVSRLNESGLSVRIRPAPGLTGLNSEKFWQEKSVNSDLSLLSCGTHQSFDHLLGQLRPRLVVAWISTTLVDALYEGILPVCLAKDDDPYIEDSTFPLFKCCLRWPRDLDTIRAVCKDDKEYWRVLERLRSNENTVGALDSATNDQRCHPFEGVQ